MLKFIRVHLLLYLFLIILTPKLFSQNNYQQILDSIDKSESFDRVRIMLGYIEETNSSGKDFEKLIHQLEKIAIDKNDQFLQKEIEHLLIKQDKVYGKNRLSKDIIYNLNEVLKIYQDRNELLYVGNCLHLIAQAQFEQKEYALSFENSFRAKEIFKKIGYQNVPNIGKFLHEIALNHYFFEDYDRVIQLMHKAEKLPKYNQNLNVQRYNNIAMAYLHKKELDSAKHYLDKTSVQVKKYKSLIWESILAGNYGEIYYQKKEFDKALQYFKKQYQANKLHFDQSPAEINKTTEFIAYDNLAKAYLAVDSIQIAKIYLDKAAELNKIIKPKNLGDLQQIQYLKSKFFRSQMNYYKKIGLYKEAMIAQDSLYQSEQFLTRNFNAAQIKMSSDRLMINEKNLKLAEIEKNKALNKLVNYTIGFLSILIIIALALFLYLNKIKAKRAIEKLTTQKTISQLEKDNIEIELKNAKTEIKHFVNKINEQNKIVEKFSSEIKKLHNLKDVEKIVIEETVDNLKNVKILTDDDWQNFQNNFAKLYPKFYQSLKKHTPAITTAEMRYLMLIKLDFTHKDMANAIGVSNDAIRVSWNRVRKKLNGTLEDTPQTLINRFEND